MNTDNATPDDGYRKAWQQAFDKAGETPPQRVWNAIEQQLDDDSRARVVPLWSQVRPWAAGIAAAVTLVLTGWWAWQALLPDQPATQAISRPSLERAVASGYPQTRPAGRSQAATDQQEMTAEWPGRQPASTQTGPRDLMATAAVPTASGSTRPGRTTIETVSDSQDAPRAAPALAVVARTTAGAGHTGTPVDGRFGQGGLVPDNVQQMALVAPSTALAPDGRLTMPVDLLTGSAFRSRKLSIQRVVWYRIPEPDMTASVASKSVKRQQWLSASVTPSSFNPAVGYQPVASAMLPSAVTTSTYDLNAALALASTRNVSLQSKSGRALAVQVSAGTQLSKRWSIEAGIGYLQAQSTVVSPVQMRQATAITEDSRSTFYTTLVQQALANDGAAAASFDRNSQPAEYDVRQEGSTRNDYRFVQVPVQVGYQLRPRRKLGLSLLGGLITNLFVRNTVNESVEVKPADHLYRGATLAGTAGARLRYQSSIRWSASMAGVYQQSLQTATQPDAGLETRPRAVGVSLGMDYHF